MTDSIIHFLEVLERRLNYMPECPKRISLEEFAQQLTQLEVERPEEYRLIREGKACLIP